LFTPEDRANDEHVKELATAAREGQASDDRWQMRKDGTRFWAAGVTTGVRDASGRLTGFTKVLRDETDRKRLEDQMRAANEDLERRVSERTGTLEAHQLQLRSLVAELGRAEIRQRRLLATELHDNLAQQLAFCKMRLGAIERLTPPDSPARIEAASVRDAIGDAIAYTRTVMTDLRPDVLDEHDLAAAIEWLAQRMARHGLKVNVQDDGEPKPVHEDVLGFLFQAVRELLWNVVKHARTTDARVVLERRDDHVCVSVIDTGNGFNPAKRSNLVPEEGGFGLLNVAERIAVLGGRMEIDSARGRGTRVTLVTPLSDTSAAADADAGRPKT
jgi:signal transduction histidine kinase